MKLNIANPATGNQKLIELEDDKKIRKLYGKSLGSEIDGAELGGDAWKGYVFKITGGNDKEGFPMKQGVLTSDRVRLLMHEGTSCFHRYRDQKRKGARKRKSVRGCIVSQANSVVSMVIVQKGEQEIENLTEESKAVPNRLQPKRANNIRKLFDLEKGDDVRQALIRRVVPLKEGSKRKKPRQVAPKIQRLITPRALMHKRQKRAAVVTGREKAVKEAQAYAKLVAQRRKEEIQKRRAAISKRKSKVSKTEEKKKATDPKAKTPVKKAATAKAPVKKAATEKKAVPAKAPVKAPAVKVAAPVEKARPAKTAGQQAPKKGAKSTKKTGQK